MPSPGIIYPMLKNLYDLKYLEMEERDGKKYYYITDSGREFLNNSWFPWKKQVEFSLKGNENSVVLDKIENNIQYLADNRDRLTSDEKLRLEKIKIILKKYYSNFYKFFNIYVILGISLIRYFIIMDTVFNGSRWNFKNFFPIGCYLINF
ncbi:PadR family transcriptional regulator [Acidiplasma cupricumulans]|uniref:PadR family transcriptional regulator n=1 Tax=Acidiplasma cupricumulans TaxID=312540 RepID=UPI00078388F9|nr:PadR family transcriptional regulator [Acidiplasma cupricumulans]